MTEVGSREATEAKPSSFGQWQPIETLPGSVMKCVVFGKWTGEVGDFSKMPPDIGVAERHRPNGTWFSTQSDYYSVECVPTHWMPLPSPPDVSKEG